MALDKKKKMLIAASVAGLIATVGSGLLSQASAAQGELEHCYGINACKGTGACGSKSGNSCAGKNACKGTGFVDVAKGSCTKIAGGKLEA